MTPDDRHPLVLQPPRWALPRLRLQELWEYRELLFFLAWRDVKVRYKQTLLGAAWAVIQPVVTMVIFTLVFGRFAGIPSDDRPYAVFSFCALVPWIYFSNALAGASTSLVGSANLITKVYFPRLIVPCSSALAGLVDLAVTFVVLVLLLAWYGIVPGPQALLIVPLVVLTLSTALGCGAVLSALNVEYRDIRYVIPFMVQIWMFVTPVIYPLSVVPIWLRPYAALNPMTGIIEGYRAALLGSPVPWDVLGISAGISVTLLLGGCTYFQRVERSFADVI